ncbi:hypothetical protein E2C01_038496 [Portunus trituberculatus]|uniref:Uncharacterized protein n=1 Tax=Portunus trituberculatus TaxID=210409 RepID=A0A5B7FHD6_PORTR|nr:hypothetical protein [Portunus trituberculatus]
MAVVVIREVAGSTVSGRTGIMIAPRLFGDGIPKSEHRFSYQNLGFHHIHTKSRNNCVIPGP